MVATPRAEVDIQMPYGCMNGKDFPCVCPCCCFKGRDTFCSPLNLQGHYPGCGPLSPQSQHRWSSSISAWPLLIWVKGNFWKRIDPLEFCWSRPVSLGMVVCCYYVLPLALWQERMGLCWCLLPAFPDTSRTLSSLTSSLWCVIHKENPGINNWGCFPVSLTWVFLYLFYSFIIFV